MELVFGLEDLGSAAFSAVRRKRDARLSDNGPASS